MPLDFVNRFAATPDNWGIVKVMERIEELSTRFGPKIPQIPQPGQDDFKTELQKNLIPYKNEKSDVPEIPKNDDLFAPGTFPNAEVPKATQFDQIISEAAKTYGVDENLVRAVIKAESNFNPSAVSPKGAMGLMQLMPGTADMLNVKNPYDPKDNVFGGVKYLRSMLDRFGGDTTSAIAAYNAGPKAVETYDGIPPYRETQDYVKRILGMLSPGS